jgi:1,4-alpha-glucan branching enzyme
MQKEAKNAVLSHISLLTEDDIFLFNQGSHFRLYEKLGSHPLVRDGLEGTYFAVWAPDAERVSVVGDFNGWHPSSHLLGARGQSGIWEGFIPGVQQGAPYKFRVQSRFRGYRADKADPFSHFNEVPPKTASIVWDLGYPWGDRDWMEKRGGSNNAQTAPLSIYEVHLGCGIPKRGTAP